MEWTDVSTILWRERNLLELLRFKLEEERLVQAADLGRWLPQATREVELVLDELRRLERSRAGALDEVAAELGLSPGRTLDEVAAAAPPPWDGLLDRHRSAFVAAAREIAPLEQEHRRLLDRCESDAIVALLDAVAEGAGRTTEPRVLQEATEGGAARRPLSRDATK